MWNARYESSPDHLRKHYSCRCWRRSGHTVTRVDNTGCNRNVLVEKFSQERITSRIEIVLRSSSRVGCGSCSCHRRNRKHGTPTLSDCHQRRRSHPRGGIPCLMLALPQLCMLSSMIWRVLLSWHG